MTVTLTTTRTGPTARYMARVLTAEGRLIAQAIDSKPERCEQRARRQAQRWANDRGWGVLRFAREGSV